MALSKLLQISHRYPPGSDEHYVFCYLSKPLMGGPALSSLTQMRLSAMKTVFDKQHSEETIPLICMLLLECGDKKSSDILKEKDANCSSNSISFTGKTVEEDKRMLYNFRCMLVYVVTNLDDSQRTDMIVLVREELACYESEKNDFQTLLLLFERATQGGLILPQKPDRLKDWLLELNREDLIRYINQFEPKKQFPGLSTPIPETGTAVRRQCSHSTEQASTTVPEVPAAAAAHAARKGHLGGTGKQESGDSAYREEDTAGGATELVLQRQISISPIHSNVLTVT